MPFFKKRMFFLPVIIFVFLPVFLFSSPSISAPGPESAVSPVQISAEIGWEGQGVPGRTAPAVIHLKNTTSGDLRGVVEAINYFRYIPPPPPGSPPGAAPAGPAVDYPVSAFGEQVTLPAGGEKKVILWLPLQGSADYLAVRFRSGEKVLAGMEAKMPLVASFSSGLMPPVTGVLGPVPPALEKVRITMPDGVPRAPLAIELTPELIPPTGEQLDAFGLILVTGEAAGSLTAEQRLALFEWAETGGHLLLAGGVRVNDTLAVFPAGAGGITSREITGNSDWRSAAAWLGTEPPAADAPAARLQGAGEPFGPPENPLGRQVEAGDGKVTVLTFDPAGAPWDAGNLGRAFWERLLQPEQPGLNNMKTDPFYLFHSLIGMVNSLPAGAFPDWRLVGVFLGIFLILAGPLTYRFLQKKQRPEYTWLAVPLLALLFSGAAYLYMLQAGKNVIVNIIQAVDARENAPAKQALTAAGFFAPTRPVFHVALADPGCPVNAQPFGGGPPPEWRKPDEEPPFTVVRGTDLEVTFREASQWGMRSLVFRQDTGETLDGLRASLRIEGSRLAGKVRNDTPLLLEHVTLFLGDDYRGLGNLAPGEEKEVDMEIPAAPVYNPQAPFSHPAGPGYFPNWLIFVYPEGKEAALQAAGQAGGPHPPDFGSPPRRLTVEEQRRAQLLDQLLNASRRHGPGSEFQRGRPPTLAAFSRDPVKESPLKNLRARPHYLSIILKKPALVIPPGNFTIPAGLTPPEIIDAQIRGSSGHNNLFGIQGGNITYAFRPGLPQNAQTKEIALEFQYFPDTAQQSIPKGAPGSPAAAAADVEAGVLEIYNSSAGQWQNLSGAKTFRLPGEYALPGGEVRLRVNGFGPASGKFVYFLPPAVSYQGVME